MLVPCLEYQFKLHVAASSPFLEYKLCWSVLYRSESQKLLILEIPKHKCFCLLAGQHQTKWPDPVVEDIKMLNSVSDLGQAE